MRLRAALIAASLAFAMPSFAAPIWTAPGWYQVADTVVGMILWKGPFASESECRETLPADDEDAEFTCEYLNERPSWDD